jgi:hypothetical protein
MSPALTNHVSDFVARSLFGSAVVFNAATWSVDDMLGCPKSGSGKYQYRDSCASHTMSQKIPESLLDSDTSHGVSCFNTTLNRDFWNDFKVFYAHGGTVRRYRA